MKKLLRFFSHRAVLVALVILLQLAVVALMLVKFQEYFVFFRGLCVALSVLAALLVVNGPSNPGYKIAWLIPILAVPLFGGVFYLVFGGNKVGRRERRRLQTVTKVMDEHLGTQEEAAFALACINEEAALQSHYIERYAACPVYGSTESEYLPCGEEKFKRMLEELAQARHYIFLEYFIIQEGIMWNAILDILISKAKQGVDVRLIYDDMGCIMTLPPHYFRQMEAAGIRCRPFCPVVPVLSARINNRDHRKICVIDGVVGFTGGVNLADEYINEYEKHGRWKDAAVLLRGEAVWSLTVMFLSMWGYVTNTAEDYAAFMPEKSALPQRGDGFVQPYGDSPLDEEPVGETVYLNLIHRARRYIYINTPYLVIDHEMKIALCMAAKSGVDVRIVTPHIPDKWYVHAVTRANYTDLTRAGVRIYEYTPGFIHSKTVAVDDEYATVGTINFDYRSLYLHFECGVWLYGTKSVLHVKEDFLNTLPLCREITYQACRRVPLWRRFGRAVLRVFAPLM